MVLRRHVEPLGELCRGDLGVHAASLEHSDSRPSKISANPANASSTTVEVGAGCFHANISMAPTAKATVAQWRSMTFPRRMRRRLASSDPARCDALSEVLAERWWAVGLRGILAIIFGLICLLTPGIALGAFVIVFAAYMFVDGVFAIISGIRAARSGENWGLLILEGVVDLAAGAIAVLWPAITLVVLVWIVAIWAIVSGALMLAAAFSLNLDYGRWWLALGGIASTVFGILLVIEPLIGAVVLTLWIGAYALVFGVFLLVLGFQLHSKREAQLRKAPAATKRA